MSITTSVTWGDLISAYDNELDEYREAYEELRETARDEFGDDWRSETLPDSPDALTDEQQTRWAYQQQADAYEQSVETIQQRQHLLDRLREEYGEGSFELKMLTGEETMEIETELRMLAQQSDRSVDVVQVRRNTLTVDAATVDAPDGVPRDDGSPAPSECPNGLTLALWGQVQALNNAGETGFTPAGLGDEQQADSPGGSSDTLEPSAPSSTPSAPTPTEET